MAAPLLDPLVVRELRKLFQTSGKAIAVYTNDQGSLHYLPVWPAEDPPQAHPKYGDHRLAGFINWATGAVGGAPTVAGQDEASAGRGGPPRAPLWVRALAVVWMLIKVMIVLWLGVIILGLLFIKAAITAAGGHSGGGGWGRR